MPFAVRPLFGSETIIDVNRATMEDRLRIGLETGQTLVFRLGPNRKLVCDLESSTPELLSAIRQHVTDRRTLIAPDAVEGDFEIEISRSLGYPRVTVGKPLWIRASLGLFSTSLTAASGSLITKIDL